jgi:ribosomal protein S18 acetylase RimI-like enzyme
MHQSPGIAIPGLSLFAPFRGKIQRTMLAVAGLTYRKIDPHADDGFTYENYLAACVASYGSDERALCRKRYRAWLRARVEEFPDGNVFAMFGGTRVGQLELQVPYGLQTGYINLYAVAAPFRGMGVGRMMHGYVDKYFRSWEATEVELHVSLSNEVAVNLYQSLGYRFVKQEGKQWRMSLTL